MAGASLRHRRLSIWRPLTYLTPWFLALVTLVGFLGWEQHQYRFDSCKQRNEIVRDRLPRAFDQYTEELGVQFNASSQRVEDVKRHMADRLDRIFPAEHC